MTFPPLRLLIATLGPPEVENEQSPAIDGAPLKQEEEKTKPATEVYDDFDDSWFLGKAREELKRRQNRQDSNEDDAVQVYTCRTQFLLCVLTAFQVGTGSQSSGA
jgi:hypothetical protein